MPSIPPSFVQDALMFFIQPAFTQAAPVTVMIELLAKTVFYAVW